MKRAKFGPVNLAELWKKSNQPLSAYVSGVVHRKIANTGRIEVKTNNGKIVSANAPDDETPIPVGMKVIVGQAAENFVVSILPRLVPTKSTVVVIP